MKILTATLLLISPIAYGQLSLETARQNTVTKYHIGASTYFDAFVGHAGYGALVTSLRTEVPPALVMATRVRCW